MSAHCNYWVSFCWIYVWVQLTEQTVECGYYTFFYLIIIISIIHITLQQHPRMLLVARTGGLGNS